MNQPLPSAQHVPAPGGPDIADIKDLVRPEEAASFWPWYLGGLLLVLLLALAGLLYLKYRRRKAAEPPPPGRVVRQGLAALSRSTRVGAADFAYHLSQVLRVWLRDRFQVPATGMSGEELSARLPETSMDDETARELALLLISLDRHKYAGQGLGEADRAGLLQKAQDLVDRAEGEAVEK